MKMNKKITGTDWKSTLAALEASSGTDLCKQLEQNCGVEGSVKDGEIIIQGDCRQRLIEILRKEGYTQTK